jgi:hypothetical protein
MEMKHRPQETLDRIYNNLMLEELALLGLLYARRMIPLAGLGELEVHAGSLIAMGMAVVCEDVPMVQDLLCATAAGDEVLKYAGVV